MDGLHLSELQLSYLDILLSDLQDLPDAHWQSVCIELIENSRVFDRYNAHAVWDAWLRSKVRH